MKSKVTKKRRKRSSTSRELTVKRSWISTLPLLTKMEDVEVVGDVVVAVDAVVAMETSAVRDQKEILVLKVMLHQDAVVTVEEEVAVVVTVEVGEEIKSSAWTKRLSQLWDRSSKGLYKPSA